MLVALVLDVEGLITPTLGAVSLLPSSVFRMLGAGSFSAQSSHLASIIPSNPEIHKVRG